MNSRERILAVLEHREPDRIPWTPLMSPTFFSSLPEYRQKFNLKFQGGSILTVEPCSLWLEEEFQELEFRVNFYKNIGADFIDWLCSKAYIESRPHVKKVQKQEKDRICVEYRTPIGSITDEWRISKEALTAFPTKEPLETPQDYKIYEYIINDTVYDPTYGRLTKQMAIVGNNGVSLVNVPPAPLKALILYGLGLEKAILGLSDHKKELEHLFQTIVQRNFEVCQILAKSPAKVFIDNAVVGTGMISPKIFKEYYVPYTKECSQILHKNGKIFINHASGEPIKPLMSMIKETQIDALYGVNLPPLGDVRIAEFDQVWGDAITIFVGIDPNFLATQKKTKIEDEVKRILDQIGERKNFILGTTDDTCSYTPIENLEAVSKVVETYK